jgi:hypothetical protein
MAMQDQHTQHKDYDTGVHSPFEPPSLVGHQEHYPIDKVVFGVSAALMLAFIAWGVLSTDNLSEVAGVLAHELGHFSQGSGMRLSYVIRSINGWFARVVFERDEWDQWLEESAQEADYRLAWILLGAVTAASTLVLVIRSGLVTVS